MGKVLLDTNILIDHLRSKSAKLPKQTLFDDFLATSNSPCIATITIQELFAGTSTREREISQQLHEFLLQFTLFPLTGRIAEEAGKLIRDYPSVTSIDAIIGATALSENISLFTKNRKDFSRIPHLTFLSP